MSENLQKPRAGNILVTGGSLLVIIFHIVGCAGFLLPAYVGLFKQLVPFHLLLMCGLIIINHQHRNTHFWTFLLLIWTAGYLIELLGVHTGLVFGNYYYGSTLGFKVAGIPLMIGVNWILVIYSAGMLVSLIKNMSIILRAVAAAVLVVLLDILIEPVAVKFDYWSWVGYDIPLRNYIAWFLFSFMLLLFFYSRNFKQVNAVAAVHFIVQFLFFVALNIAI